MALLILKGKKDMKKIVLMLVALVSMTTMAFAEGENAKAANEAAAYDMRALKTYTRPSASK